MYSGGVGQPLRGHSEACYSHHYALIRVHPKSPDGTSLSFQFINEEFASSRSGLGPPFGAGSQFLQGLENQGIARNRTQVRRTRNPAD